MVLFFKGYGNLKFLLYKFNNYKFTSISTGADIYYFLFFNVSNISSASKSTFTFDY